MNHAGVFYIPTPYLLKNLGWLGPVVPAGGSV
jgi:hypothetical protein